MRQPLDFALPRQRGWPRVALAISIALHLLLFLGPIESRRPDDHPRAERIIVLEPDAPESPKASENRHYLSPEQPAEAGRVTRRGIRGPGVQPDPSPTEPRLPSEKPMPAAPADTGQTAPARRRGFGRIAPEYGQGVLWVRPVPVSPAELAQRLEESHFEHVDSAVTAIMQAFLDSLATEPGADGAALPSWTTQIAGSKFGLDSRYIYLAGLKIPAAILALLPLPQGNIDQAKAYNHLMDLRADIERAARRAENMDEFKRAIREIRERKQRERDFERAQREPPPPRDPPNP